jgi:hypothetical protein
MFLAIALFRRRDGVIGNQYRRRGGNVDGGLMRVG